MLITSRGCPYHCTFCSIFLTAGRQFRVRPLNSIIDEMKLCRTRFGTEIFDIEDDNFSFDQKRAARILAAIREEFGEGQIELLAMNGISAANLSPSLLHEMKRSGFRALNLALVTSDKQQQRATKRPGSTSQFDHIVQTGAELNLEMVNYLILGLPDATLAEMMDSIIHLMERPVLIGPSVFYATPGTESFQQCVARGLLPSRELALQRSTCFPVETENFSRLDLVTLFRICRWLNFIKSRLDAMPPTIPPLRWALRTSSVDREPYSFNELLSAPIFAETMPKPGAQYQFSRKLNEMEIGGWLAQAFWQDGHFLGMKLMHRAPDRVAYQVFAEEFSLQVLGLFFERASGKRIFGVKNHGAWTVLPVRNVRERILAPNSLPPQNAATLAGDRSAITAKWP